MKHLISRCEGGIVLSAKDISVKRKLYLIISILILINLWIFSSINKHNNESLEHEISTKIEFHRRL